MRLYVDVLPWSRKDGESMRNSDTQLQKPTPDMSRDGEVAAVGAGDESIDQG